jgi:cell division protein FtsW
MAKIRLSEVFKGDRGIWAMVVLFMFYSLLAVYSSSVSVAFLKYGGNTTYFLRSQFFMLLFGLIIIIITSHLNYKIYSALANIIFASAVALLVLTLFVGVRINEATRWLEIPGTGFRLQTSDLAKVALVIYLARVLAKYQNELNDFGLVSRVFVAPIGIVCALIMSENLSSAVMIFGICMIILYVGRVPVKFLLAYGGMAIVLILIFAAVLTFIVKDNRVEVWKNRIEAFVSGDEDPDQDYQSNQAKIAISTGGLFGKMPGKSVQRNMLPQSNSDFIFAIIVEEYGLLFGAIPLIMAYLVLLYRGIAIAKRCETAFPAFLVLGLVIMIAIQAILNMLVAVGLFPVTGQTLPLVSWGRSSVLIMSFSIGAILGVSRLVNARLKKEELPEEERADDEERIYEPAKA